MRSMSEKVETKTYREISRYIDEPIIDSNKRFKGIWDKEFNRRMNEKWVRKEDYGKKVEKLRDVCIFCGEQKDYYDKLLEKNRKFYEKRIKELEAKVAQYRDWLNLHDEANKK